MLLGTITCKIDRVGPKCKIEQERRDGQGTMSLEKVLAAMDVEDQGDDHQARMTLVGVSVCLPVPAGGGVVCRTQGACVCGGGGMCVLSRRRSARH